MASPWHHLTPSLPASGLAGMRQAPVMRRWSPKRCRDPSSTHPSYTGKGWGGPKPPRVEQQDSGPKTSKKKPATSNAWWKIEIN